MDLERYIARHHSQRPKSAPTFLNHAGASLPDARVIERITTHLELERRVGGYAAASEVSEERSELGVLAAEIVGCVPEQIALVDSGTRAWNAILYSSLGLSSGDNIVTAPYEFGSNLVSLLDVARSAEAEVRFAELTPSGSIDTDSLIESVDERTKLVAVSILNAHFGAVTHLHGVGEQVHRQNPDCIFLVDGCQAVGQLPVNIDSIGCDVFTATGRKWLRGPRGTGFLYVGSESLERLRPPSLDLINTDLVPADEFGNSSLSIRPDVKRFESWERSIAIELGFIESLRIANGLGIAATSERVAALARRLRSGLEGSQFRVLEETDEPSGIVGLVSAHTAADEIVNRMRGKGFEIGAMHEWDAPLYFSKFGLDSTLRISAGFLNSEEEIDQCLEHLTDM